MKTNAALILAAGQGKRMRSKLPKVLHPCGGMPLVAHVVQTALALRCDPIVVVIDPKGARVRELLTATFPDAPLRFAVQEKALGTGDATRAGLAALGKFNGNLFILCGDVPLLRGQTLKKLAKGLGRKNAKVAVLTARAEDPTGYGRILRNGGSVVGIVEHKDADKAERAIDEINTGVYFADAAFIAKTLPRLTADNKQGEFYLTDIVAHAARDAGAVGVSLDDFDEVRGVNTQGDLAAVEKIFRLRIIDEHRARGVRFLDADTAYIDAQVKLAADVEIGIGVQLRGRTKIAAGARIEGPTVIIDSTVGKDARVLAFSHLQDAKVGAGANVGPYARLRPQADIGDGARVGNFVEVKKARLGKGAKANHLAYIGDAEIGAESNIGAGTITCNYDGVNKHQTTLGKGVFIGSNATLVAPVTIGDGAYIAAGSTITQKVEKDALAFGRSRQASRAGYGKRLRERTKKRGK